MEIGSTIGNTVVLLRTAPDTQFGSAIELGTGRTRRLEAMVVTVPNSIVAIASAVASVLSASRIASLATKSRSGSGQ